MVKDLPLEELGRDAGLAERKLWGAALASLVDDARAYWQGKGVSGITADSTVLEAAFDDLCRCGPMLRRLCSMTGHDADWISQGFIRWCDGH